MISSIWLIPLAPPVIAAGLTTIDPKSRPTAGKQFGGVTVTKLVQLASYSGGGKTVIDPPKVCWTEQVKGSTVSKVYVNVVSAATSGACPLKVTILPPAIEILFNRSNPKPAGEEVNVTSFAEPPNVNCTSWMAVSSHTDWFNTSVSAPEKTIEGRACTVIVISWVWSAHILVLETAPDTPVVISNV